MNPAPDLAPSPLRRPEFRNLMAISITVALGFGMVVPVLPTYAKSFGVSLAAIGLVQLVFGATRFAFGLVGGMAVDRFGERACTIAGLLIVAASSYAMGFSTTFLQLVLARGFGGAGSAFFIQGLQNRIIRTIEPQAMGRASGIFRSSFLVGFLVGPVLGGIVAKQLGASAVFHIYATGLLVASVIAFVVMRGRRRIVAAEKKSPVEALRAARPLFGDIRFLVALLATFVAWFTASGPAQIVGVVYAEDVLGYSADKIGVALSMLAVGEIIVLFFTGRASDRFGRRAVLVPSLALIATGVALLGQIESMPNAFFPLLMVIGGAISAGSTASGGLLADAVATTGSGTAVGVNQMAGDLGYLMAPVLIGAIAESFGYGTAYLIAAIPAGVVFFVALRLPRSERISAVASVPDGPNL